MKLGQMDRETFEKLRDDIVGGDISKTHLIKGLDKKLLERVRRGEDVLSSSGQMPQKEDDSVLEPAVDDELDSLEQKEVAPVVRQTVEKKGQMGPPPSVAGTKRSRDAILAELKAARQAAAEAKAAAQPQLGPKFHRLGEKRETSRIERDAKGREVMITVDEEGNIKRKIRKTEQGNQRSVLLMPDKNTVPLGMEVPEILPAAGAEKEDDGDIFDDVGDEYNPLGELGDDEEAPSSEEEDAPKPQNAPSQTSIPAETEPASDDDSREAPPPVSADTNDIESTMPPPQLPASQRNYFNDKPQSTSSAQPPDTLVIDPTLLAALRKTRDIPPLPTRPDTNNAPEEDDDEEKEARLRRRAALLASSDRDMQDLDLGFGSSRFDDAEDLDEGSSRVKLSRWKASAAAGGDDDDDDGRDGECGGKKRKRGPKKRKGDKNSAADVLKVLEARKGAGR